MSQEDQRLFDLAHMTEPFCAKGAAVVAATTLNVRSAPSAKAAVLGKLAAGAAVDVWAVAAGGEWFLVQDARPLDPKKALTGWCSAIWLQVVGRLVA